MKEIKITLSLPILIGGDSAHADAYADGYTHATLEPIIADIDEGVLNIARMLAAGWEISIPEHAESSKVFTGGIGGPLTNAASE